MIELPNVTLVCVDCLNYLGAIKALLHSQKKINFGETLFLTDKVFYHEKYKTIQIYRINSKEEYSKFMLTKLNKYINTEFCLVIQWDGYVINPDLWINEFLNYDYIGAPWWYTDGHNVGNGGFSLRSKVLMNTFCSFMFLGKEYGGFNYHPEDDFIGRNARDILEDDFDIKFAPEEIAKQFSYEPNVKREPFKNHTFGFHGIQNLIMR